MLIIRSWLCPKCTFKRLCTLLSSHACKIDNASGAPAESKKVRDVSKRVWRRRSPEERSYDVSRGQNRYVTLPVQTVAYPARQFSRATQISNYCRCSFRN